MHLPKMSAALAVTSSEPSPKDVWNVRKRAKDRQLCRTSSTLPDPDARLRAEMKLISDLCKMCWMDILVDRRSRVRC